MRFSLDTERLLDQAFVHSLGRPLSEPMIQKAITHLHRNYQSTQQEIDQVARGQFQRAAQLAGLHAVQAALYQGGGDLDKMEQVIAETAECKIPNWELVAAVETLASMNMTIAGQHLPKRIRELAEEWSWVDASRQREICEELFIFLSRFHRKEEDPAEKIDELDLSTAWCQDYLRQEPQRIFPRHFLTQENVEPNCLGKAQMLLAFFEIAEAQVLGLTPISLSEDAVHSTLGHLSDAMSAWAEDNDIEISAKLLKRFARRKKAAELLNSYPSRFHMTVAVRLADNSWFVIDPHMQVRGQISNPLEISFAAQMVGLLCPVLPGFCSLSSEGGAMQKATLSAAMAAGRVFDKCSLIKQRWASVDHHPGAAIPLFSASGALDLFLAEGIGVLERDKELYQRIVAGEQAAILTFKRGRNSEETTVRFRADSGRELSLEETMRLQVSMSVLSLLAVESEADIGRLDDTALHARGLRKALSILPSVAYKHAAEKLGVTQVGGRLLHPAFEVYEPKFRVGIEQLAHLNALCPNPSNRTVMELAAICGGQHHQALGATEALRDKRGQSSQVAWSAIDVLQKSPVKISVAEEALAELRRQGVLFSEPPVDTNSTSQPQSPVEEFANV